MKKLSAVLVAAILVVASAVTAFAAGINSSEQAVLDELNSTLTVNGGTFAIPEEYINQAENYFNTVDMTEEESTEIIAQIQAGKDYIKSTGAASIEEMTIAQKEKLLSYGEAAAAVMGLTLTYDRVSKVVTVTGANGEQVVAGSPSVSGGQISENNVVKTTGSFSDYTTFIVVGAVLVLAVAGGTVYLAKTKKESV